MEDNQLRIPPLTRYNLLQLLAASKCPEADMNITEQVQDLEYQPHALLHGSAMKIQSAKIISISSGISASLAPLE